MRGLNPDRRNRLLAALRPPDLLLLEPHLKETALEHGALLHEQGEKIERVYFPNSGMISLLTVMRQGNAVETATIGREGAVGLMSGLGPRHAFGRAVVQMGGSALQIPSARFRTIVDGSHTLRELIVRYNEALLVQVQQTAACNALHDAEPRLCRWLLQSCDRSDSSVLPLTQEFLAQMLGVRRTTVTLVAQILQDKGIVRYRRGRIEIVNRAALEQCACECYHTVKNAFDHHVAAAER